MERPSEEEVNQAQSVLRRWAAAEVDDIVTDLKSEIESGEITDMGELTDAVREQVDNDQCVIYTWKAMLMTVFGEADPDGMLEEIYGSDAGTVVWKDGINWSILAYSVMEKDVLKALDYADINEDYFDMIKLKDEPCHWCDKPIEDGDPVEYIELPLGGGRVRGHVECPEDEEEAKDDSDE